MPRGPRLDAPGALHHVIGRGVARREVFRDDEDREDFLARVGKIVLDAGWFVYAWALMPNHFHLLVRTGGQPLSRSMRALLSGYAARFNRRHEEVGHLFQNRFKSILCEDEGYFHALVRYIHRNPIPGIVPSERALRRYPFTGHAGVLGIHPRAWQDVDAVLERFGRTRSVGIERYQRFVEADDADGSGVDLDGGGIRRSRPKFDFVGRLERGRERSRADERILGSDAFVGGVLEHIRQTPGAAGAVSLEQIASVVCEHAEISLQAVRGSGRSRAVAHARGGIAWLWVRRLGGSNRELARFLGLSDSPTLRAVKRGEAAAREWNRLLEREHI